ncbi:MAG: spore coat protein U domain-containing protein [Rhizobiales bacterium]|nr:spore coat protein U domain-containing protein [Hyphomicrobiales bacterium]
MKFSGYLAIGAAAMLGLAGHDSGASADTLGVSASVPDACSINAGTLPFGTYDPATQINDLAGSGSFEVVCTLTADVDVTLDAGVNPAGGTRRLLGSSGDFLTYALFQDPGFSNEWGDNSVTHSGTARSFPAMAATTNVIDVSGLIQGARTFAAAPIATRSTSP